MYFSFIGMTISMMICTFYPNGTDLRVEVDPNKNVFCYLVQMIHNSDTPANVFPSIHVYNSVRGPYQCYRQRTPEKSQMGPPELIYHHGGYLHVYCIF